MGKLGAREVARLPAAIGGQGRAVGWAPEAVWSQETSLGSRVPHRHVLQPLPRERPRPWEAVPTVLRADVVAELPGTFTGVVVGGEYNQLEMRLH